MKRTAEVNKCIPETLGTEQKHIREMSNSNPPVDQKP